MVHESGVSPDLFADPWAGWLWRLINDRLARGLPVGPLDLAPLCKAEELPGLDGAWLGDIYSLSHEFVRQDVGHLSVRIRQDHTKRKLVATGTRIAQMAEHAPPEDVDAVWEAARKEVDSCFIARGDLVTVGDVLDDVIIDLTKEKKKPLPTPWIKLNEMIHGWNGGRLYTVAAATGFGKSIMGLQIAAGLAEHGPVSFSSLEMPREECVHRLIASTAMVDLGSLTNPPVTEAVMRQIERKRGDLEKLKNIVLDDRANVTLADVEHQAREVRRTMGGLSAVIVDYIQVVKWDGAKSVPRNQQLADMSWRLKALSKDLQVPVFQLAQINRTGQQREGNEPTLSDLKDSADLENTSDVVLIGWLPDLENETDGVLKVAKARGWRKGKFPVRRSGAYALIQNDIRAGY